jgi:UDP-N-acetyl-D-mannosaminuronate dehydrogenase
MGKIVAATPITILGVSYREDVGDTRYSGSEILVRKLTEMGAEIRAHDPYVEHWWEIEKQDSYPATGQSLSRFFRNQQELDGFAMTRELPDALRNAEAVVFAVRHDSYLSLLPEDVLNMAGGPFAVVDCFGILSDQQIERYFELGCEVKALGRGHVNRIKDKVRKSGPDSPTSS